jgi:hypothetical protein
MLGGAWVGCEEAARKLEFDEYIALVGEIKIVSRSRKSDWDVCSEKESEGHREIWGMYSSTKAFQVCLLPSIERRVL